MTQSSDAPVAPMEAQGDPPVGICPICRDPLDRVRRRPIDHLVSVFYSVRRYRCRNITCKWEGNLPYRTPKGG